MTRDEARQEAERIFAGELPPSSAIGARRHSTKTDGYGVVYFYEIVLLRNDRSERPLGTGATWNDALEACRKTRKSFKDPEPVCGSCGQFLRSSGERYPEEL